MMKHEYRVEGRPSHRAASITDWLNDLAAEGWRLVQVADGLYYFEREVSEVELKDLNQKMLDL